MQFEEVGNFQENDIIGCYKKDRLFVCFLVAIWTDTRVNRIESDLLILDEFDFGAHDLQEVIDVGDILTVNFHLPFDLNSSIWSSSVQFGVNFLEVRKTHITKSNCLNR